MGHGHLAVGPATALINLVTCLALLIKLHWRLGGLPLKEWTLDTLKIIFAGILAGFVAWFLKAFINWPIGIQGLFIEVALPSLTSILVYSLPSEPSFMKGTNLLA